MNATPLSVEQIDRLLVDLQEDPFANQLLLRALNELRAIKLYLASKEDAATA